MTDPDETLTGISLMASHKNILLRETKKENLMMEDSEQDWQLKVDPALKSVSGLAVDRLNLKESRKTFTEELQIVTKREEPQIRYIEKMKLLQVKLTRTMKALVRSQLIAFTTPVAKRNHTILSHHLRDRHQIG